MFPPADMLGETYLVFGIVVFGIVALVFVLIFVFGLSTLQLSGLRGHLFSDAARDPETVPVNCKR